MSRQNGSMIGRRPIVLAAGLLAATVLMPTGTASAEAGLSIALTDTGKREYYCQATFELSTPAEAPYQDVNGYFYVFVDDERVGRSKGASFRFADGDNAASATFETPNAPCPDVNGYVFVVGACMQGSVFIDRTECASSIASRGVVREVRAR